MVAVVVVRRALVLMTLAGGTLVWWQALADLRRRHARLEGDVAHLSARLVTCQEALHEVRRGAHRHSANLDDRVAALEAAEDARHKGLPAPRTPRPRKERAP